MVQRLLVVTAKSVSSWDGWQLQEPWVEEHLKARNLWVSEAIGEYVVVVNSAKR